MCVRVCVCVCVCACARKNDDDDDNNDDRAIFIESETPNPRDASHLLVERMRLHGITRSGVLVDVLRWIVRPAPTDCANMRT